MDIKPVAFGLRRKSDGAYVGLIPQKIAGSLPKSDEYLDRYDEVAIYDEPAVEALQRNLNEQCKLHAIGMERELALIGRAQRAEAEVKRLRVFERDRELYLLITHSEADEWEEAEARAERAEAEAARLRQELAAMKGEG